MMATVEEGLQWSGIGATVSLFVVTEIAVLPNLLMAVGPTVPDDVRCYRLEDEYNVLEGRAVCEFDAIFAELPTELEKYLKACLAEALTVGGIVAWFGFEGSFDFEHLLTDDIAPQVFGVGDSDGIAVVLSEGQLVSELWKERVRSAGSYL